MLTELSERRNGSATMLDKTALPRQAPAITKERPRQENCTRDLSV